MHVVAPNNGRFVLSAATVMALAISDHDYRFDDRHMGIVSMLRRS